MRQVIKKTKIVSCFLVFSVLLAPAQQASAMPVLVPAPPFHQTAKLAKLLNTCAKEMAKLEAKKAAQDSKRQKTKATDVGNISSKTGQNQSVRKELRL